MSNSLGFISLEDDRSALSESLYGGIADTKPGKAAWSGAHAWASAEYNPACCDHCARSAAEAHALSYAGTPAQSYCGDDDCSDDEDDDECRTPAKPKKNRSALVKRMGQSLRGSAHAGHSPRDPTGDCDDGCDQHATRSRKRVSHFANAASPSRYGSPYCASPFACSPCGSVESCEDLRRTSCAVSTISDWSHSTCEDTDSDDVSSTVKHMAGSIRNRRSYDDGACARRYDESCSSPDFSTDCTTGSSNNCSPTCTDYSDAGPCRDSGRSDSRSPCDGSDSDRGRRSESTTSISSAWSSGSEGTDFDEFGRRARKLESLIGGKDRKKRLSLSRVSSYAKGESGLGW